MHAHRTLIVILAVLLLAAACGKSGRRNLAPTLLPGAAGAPAQASSADGYGFGADGFIPGTDFYPDRFVVGFKDSAKGVCGSAAGEVDYNPRSRLYQNTEAAALAREIRERYSLTLDKEAYVRGVNFASYQMPDGSCAKEVMERIWADYAEAIEYIEYDGVRYPQYVPNDPDYPANLWGMVKIEAEDAWDTERGDDSVLVCIIDTGVRYSEDSVDGYPDHEDLADNYLHPPDYWPDEQFDLFDEDNVPEDAHGHGSHVSGTIGAVGDNSKGVVGVCHDISMVMIRVFGTGSCPDSWVATAVTLATEIESDVISMSLGGTFPNLATKEACEDAYEEDIFLAVAAANSNTDKPYYPGYYEVNCCVGATDSSDNKAGFSNYGQWVDIAAPGVGIKSCGYTSPTAYLPNWSGTSMATPHVAGAAALLLSYDPTLTVEELRAALESTGAALTPSEWGNPDIRRLDVDAALDFVIGDEFGTPPTAEITSPENLEDVSGTVTIEADASDSDGSILKVFFLIDDVLKGTDDSAPYSYDWDSTKHINGNHTIKAVALDNQHMTGADTITVAVDNDCETPNYFIDFESGAPGWWSTDEDGPGYWQLVDNDGASGTHSYHHGGAGGGNYGSQDFDRLFSPVFDLSGLQAVRLKFKHHYAFAFSDYGYVIVNDGSHDFIILDDFGPGTLSSWTQETYSLDDYIGDSIQIVFLFEEYGGGYAAGWWIDDFAVEKKTAPCAIDITSPEDGADVSGSVDFAAEVTDDVEVTLVEMYIDGSLKASFAGTGPYEYSWVTTDYHGGYHELEVYAEDEWPTGSEESIAVYVKNHAITGADPASGVTGTAVTVEGTHFVADGGDTYNASTDKLYFTGASGWTQASVSNWQAGSITAAVPADAVTGPVMVDINGAQVTSSFDFTVLPHLTALTPDVQVVGGNITVEGTGFGNQAGDDGAVAIGGVECAIVAWSNTEIEITIPPGVTRSDLTVTTAAGISNGLLFTPRPNILALTPDRTWVGQQLAIGGTSFGDEQGESTVTFAGPVLIGPEHVISWSETELLVTVPAGAQRGDVVVTVNGIESAGAFLRVVLPPPEMSAAEQY